MPCSCIAHSHLMHTPLLLLSCRGLYLVFSSLTCDVYFILCRILFLRCFVFCLSFISHSWCTLYASYPCSCLHFFHHSFFLVYLSIPDKKEESLVISIWLLCTFLGGEILSLVHIDKGRNFIVKMHIPRRRRHLFIRKPCSILFVFLFYLWCFEVLLVFMLCCSYHIVFICWTCIHSLCLVLYWLHVRMIICFAKWSL